MSSIASPRSWTPRAIPAWAPAAVAAAVYLVLAPPSADLAAQYYRADLGLVLWDNGWYGGHHMPGYSLLFPPLAHVLAPRLVGALSAVAAAWIFERLVRETEGGRIAALWFAVATATTLISGRLTFALGLAVGLGAVLAAARGRHGWACALAALSSIASPVAGAFVALAAAAWWLDRPRGWPVGLGTCAVAPAIALAIAFPEGGSFPFVASSFWPALAASIAVGLVIPREARVVRIGIALYAVAIVASFALQTPMGGNVVRLGALFAGPVLAALVWRTNRRALALLALPLVYWQWVAPVDDWARAAGDASVHERYYDGLLGFLGTQRGGPFRLEIPFTDNHWESRWVAPHVPLARGWERQVDRQRNALFYDDRPITPARYRRWLDDNAVRFVALADAPIDYSAAREAQLVRHGTPYLREVWHDAHWRVYAVAGARPLASGAARVTAVEPERVGLTASRAGLVDLRVHFTPYWRIATGTGCVGEGPGGWTRLRVERPGPVVLEASFALGRVRASAPRCTG
ncbi:MAG: hypothetical protein ACXVFM_06045 [Solirubrobacteraceae bacterium]